MSTVTENDPIQTEEGANYGGYYPAVYVADADKVWVPTYFYDLPFPGTWAICSPSLAFQSWTGDGTDYGLPPLTAHYNSFNDCVYVLVDSGASMMRFDSDGTLAWAVTPAAAHQYVLSYDADGSLYAVDNTATPQEINEFDPTDGSLIALRYTLPTGYVSDWPPIIDGDGNIWFCARNSPFTEASIYKLDTSMWTAAAQWTTTSSSAKPGRLAYNSAADTICCLTDDDKLVVLDASSGTELLNVSIGFTAGGGEYAWTYNPVRDTLTCIDDSTTNRIVDLDPSDGSEVRSETIDGDTPYTITVNTANGDVMFDGIAAGYYTILLWSLGAAPAVRNLIQIYVP